jgi:hypothetical protein
MGRRRSPWVWFACLLAALVSGAVGLLALLAAGYTHTGSSPFGSEFAKWGQFAFALLAGGATALAFTRLNRGAPAAALTLAATAVLIAAFWWFLLVALWE